MKRSLITLSWVLCVSHVMQGAFAQEFTPATISEDDRSISRTLSVPVVRPSGRYNVSLRCQVIVERDGAVTHPHCLVFEHYRMFEQEAMKALSDAVMTPATVDGEAVRVVMNLLIGYRCTETCEIVLAPSHAWNVESLGLGYSAPQPILEDGQWYEGYEQKLEWVASGQSAEDVQGVRFVVSTWVDEEGRSSDRQVEGESAEVSDVSYRAISLRAARSLRSVRYIPGFHHERPTEMRLYEYWLDPDGRPPETITLPVRVHLLSSVLVPELDSTLEESEVFELFEEANLLWQQAGIEWAVESITRTDAARQLGFRRVTAEYDNSDGDEKRQILSTVCPQGLWLEDGWNVCIIGQHPWVADYFPNRSLLLGERGPLGQPVLRPWILARELGHSLGLKGRGSPCDVNLMRTYFLRSEASCVIYLTPTELNSQQIRTARAQAVKGVPFRLPAPMIPVPRILGF